MPSEQLQQFRLRPAVIVSKDENNSRLDDLMIAPCTSNISRQREPTQYLIEGEEIIQAGIRVASVVRCESLFTIYKSMVLRVLGRLSSSSMNHLNECLRNALGLA
jgi:mRNA interferase MazF